MNREIKEILDMFTKYKDNWYSVEYILKPKQCVILFDYITNLQEELEYQKQAEQEYNEKHTKLMKKYKKSCETYQQALDETMSEKMDLEKENDRLKETLHWKQLESNIFYKSRIDKAIEEKKIPEKLKIEQDTPTSNYYIRNENGTKCSLTKHSKMIAETLNQLLDYLKSKGE